jgi:putative redox protein
MEVTMKIQCTWHEKMRFSAEADQHKTEMDTKPPIGEGSAHSPKQLLLAAICGCTGMDVVALLKKYKQPIESFQVDAEADSTEGKQPVVFKSVRLTFQLAGPLDSVKVLEAVHLSQTRYCGVSAMLSKATPIFYTVELNGGNIGEGRAEFES